MDDPLIDELLIWVVSQVPTRVNFAQREIRPSRTQNTPCRVWVKVPTGGIAREPSYFGARADSVKF